MKTLEKLINRYESKKEGYLLDLEIVTGNVERGDVLEVEANPVMVSLKSKIETLGMIISDIKSEL